MGSELCSRELMHMVHFPRIWLEILLFFFFLPVDWVKLQSSLLLHSEENEIKNNNMHKRTVKKRNNKENKKFVLLDIQIRLALLANIYFYGCIFNFYSFYLSFIMDSFFSPWIYFLKILKSFLNFSNFLTTKIFQCISKWCVPWPSFSIFHLCL